MTRMSRTAPSVPCSPPLGRWATILIALARSACTGTEPPAEAPIREGLRAINGTELYVKRMGTGEPMIVIHGGPVLEHGYLLPHLAPLPESHELIFFDQRLNGRCAAVVDGGSVRLATFVDDVEALRLALGLDRIGRDRSPAQKQVTTKQRWRWAVFCELERPRSRWERPRSRWERRLPAGSWARPTHGRCASY